jgi:GNAT superfamily N-acetyltransferase
MNTVEQIQSQIADNLQAFAEGKIVQLVAEVDGTVIGVVSLKRNSHPLAAHRAEVVGLVVNPKYQGQGIARRLVEECRNQGSSMSLEILEVSCRAGEPAEQVYHRLGFIEYGRLPRGIIESWGERKIFDTVYFYQPVERKP